MQQTTINLPSTNPVRALTGLARQIALPGEFAPERFPSFPALERTAVMGFSNPVTLQVPNDGSAVHGFLTRQAVYPLWVDTVGKFTAGYAVQWKATAENISYSALSGAMSFGGSNIYQTTVDGASPPANYMPVSTGLVGGRFAYPVIGVDRDTTLQPWIYIPTGYRCILALNVTSAWASSAGATVTFDLWNGPGEISSTVNYTFTFSTTTTVAFADVAFTFGGRWMRPNFVEWNQTTTGGLPAQALCSIHVGNAGATTSTVGYGTITWAGSLTQPSLVPVTYASEYGNSNLPWKDTRVTASAALFTNVTQVLNKNGTILAGRMSPTVTNPWAVTYAQVQALHPAEKAWLPLETGLYTYCPPSTDMALFVDYDTVAVAAAGSNHLPVYRLDNTSLVNHFYFTSAATVAETLAATVSWHFEFRTSSALFQIALSGLTLESLHAAQIALAKAGFFFENPEHNGVLNKIINAVKTVAPHLLTVASAFPALAPAVAAVNAARTAYAGPAKVSVPQAAVKMPATTLARSTRTIASPGKAVGVKKKKGAPGKVKKK